MKNNPISQYIAPSSVSITFGIIIPVNSTDMMMVINIAIVEFISGNPIWFVALPSMNVLFVKFDIQTICCHRIILGKVWMFTA